MERMLEFSTTGARVRVSAVESSNDIEPLGEPDVSYEADGIRVRHIIAVFAPGTLQVELSDIELIYADGTFETADGGTALVVVESVLPFVADSSPEARPSLAPIGRVTRNLNLATVLPLVVLLGCHGLGCVKTAETPTANMGFRRYRCRRTSG